MESMALLSGSQLKHGEYRIVRVLGQGGFGITYEAEQVSLGRKVAVKEFFMKNICNRHSDTSYVSIPSTGSKELVGKFRQKFIREAQMIAGLDHEHIVKIYDVFEENGTAYYVMEYLGGGSLADELKRDGALSEATAVKYIRQVADALQYLHSQNILHFDVKPSNILLGMNGSAKLIDFGISKHYNESGSQTSSTPVGISKGFSPLEQYQQDCDIKMFTPATDIYSLGATLYTILVGDNPPEASVVGEEGLSSKPYNVSSQLWYAVEQAMSFRRKDRPQSITSFLSLLDGEPSASEDVEGTILEGEKKPNAPVESTKLESPISTERHGFPKWLWGVAAVFVVGLAMFALFRNPSSSPGGGTQRTGIVHSVTEVTEEPVKTEPLVVALESLSLDKESLELEEGASGNLTAEYVPSNVTDKSTTWESSDVNVATVSKTGKVTAVKAGNAAIAATCGGKTAYCIVTIKPNPTTAIAKTITNSTSSATGKVNGHEWVDLGLSVKWATCNVGATNPTGYGSYFAWGETKSKGKYEFEDCLDCLNAESYYFDSSWGIYKEGGKMLITPDSGDDAARANWGGLWRLPTELEIEELCTKCTWRWGTKNGVKGYTVTGPNSNSIFLPAAGYIYITRLDEVNACGYYWSNTLSQCSGGRGLMFGNRSHHPQELPRYNGQSVRPVTE